MAYRKNAARPREEIPVLQADPAQGLTAQEVSARTAAGWTNAATVSAGRSEKDIILGKLLTYFNLVFIVLAVVLALAGSSLMNMTFMIVVVINAIIGIFQEIRAKRAVDALTLVAAAQLRVIRDGAVSEVRSDLLVRDDIVEFTPGNQICADGVLRQGQLWVNEALVTGEEEPVVKEVGDTLRSGSFVVTGTGRAQLTHVGEDSFAARLAREAKNGAKSTKSEMMNALDKLIRVVGLALIPVGLVLFYQEFKVLQHSLTDSAEATVAALVGMIPEGLYLLTSVAMAVSALKLTKKRVLVQDMNCIESLARVDVLCLDKTGTITEATMQVEDVIPLSNETPERLETILSAIYSDLEPENDTGRAMIEMFARGTDWECVRRVPFTSQTKWSAAVFRNRGTYLVGAPETTLGSRYHEVQQVVEGWSAKGYRVLLIAGYSSEPTVPLTVEKLTPLALILLTNRIRPEAPATFAYFAQQGVAIKVISGDNPLTVSEVAQRAGIAGAEKYIDANELDLDSDFERAVEEYTVFGRVTPDQKKRLILALKKKRHTVAMTGDGVNDVLAMQAADCAVAIAGGAQAASQVAKLVLLDADFSAMPHIVDEGRRVINNIQRAATLFLVKNIFSFGLALITLFTGWGYPLIPLHLTMISALTIGVPSFFLAMEPNYERVRGKFLETVLYRALPGGLTDIFVVLMAQAFMVVFGLSQGETATACAAILSVVGMLVLYQVCKPFDKFRTLIWWAMAVALVICFVFLGNLFELQAGTLQTDLILAALLIMTPTVFQAIRKGFLIGEKVIARLRKTS